jgi:hypothetical protein
MQFPLVSIQAESKQKLPTITTHSSEYGNRFMRQFRAYKLQAAGFLRSRWEQSHTFDVEEESHL